MNFNITKFQHPIWRTALGNKRFFFNQTNKFKFIGYFLSNYQFSGNCSMDMVIDFKYWLMKMVCIQTINIFPKKILINYRPGRWPILKWRIHATILSTDEALYERDITQAHGLEFPTNLENIECSKRSTWLAKMLGRKSFDEFWNN